MVFRFLFLFLMALPCYALDIAGVKLADEDRKLVLNGAGLRKVIFIQVYAIGIYLPEKKSAAADVIAAQGAKRVLLHMLRDADADDFSEALLDGVKANHDPAEMKALEPRLRQLFAIMAEIKQAKKGMRITLDWLPAAGTQVAVDDQAVGAPIAGEDFYRALLRIWLGEHPVQSDLKKALLGG